MSTYLLTFIELRRYQMMKLQNNQNDTKEIKEIQVLLCLGSSMGLMFPYDLKLKAGNT